MTQTATWIQLLALLKQFTDTKESILTMDNLNDAPLLSEPLRPVSELQIRRSDFFYMKRFKQAEYISELNLLRNLH